MTGFNHRDFLKRTIHCFTEDYKLLVEKRVWMASSDEEKLNILSDYEAGMSIKGLSAKYNRDEVSISGVIKSFGLERRLDKIKKLLLSTFESDHEITRRDISAFCDLNNINVKVAITALEKAGKKIIIPKRADRISQDVIDKIENMYEQGKGFYEMSKILGISMATIRGICSRLGLIKPKVTDKDQRILDFVDACYNKPVFLTTAEMEDKLQIRKNSLSNVLYKHGVKKPGIADIILKWLEMNIDPNTGYINPIHYRTLANRLNIAQTGLRRIMKDNPQWHLTIDNGVMRDTRDSSDASFLYQDEWDQADDYEDIENVGEIEDFEDQFEEPAPAPPKRRAEPKTPIFTTGLRRSKPKED